MSRSGRGWNAPVGVEAALAFVVSVGFFALAATVINAVERHLPVLVLAAVCLLAIFAIARSWGVAFAVPVSIAGMLAFDWFYIPPKHFAGLPDAGNLLALVAYLAIAVVVGQLVARADRRADVSEVARSVLADEQAALRHVATLVAHGVAPAEVFAAVAEEIGRIMHLDIAAINRFESHGTMTVVANCNDRPTGWPVNSTWPIDRDSVAGQVFRTHRPARMDDLRQAPGGTGEAGRRYGIRSAVGAPIIVDDRLWGVAIGGSTEPDALPADTERRIANFTELIATAISNAETRTELTASRARVVAAADETRRRLERDLHDGIQQQLVTLALEVRSAEVLASRELDGDLRLHLHRIGDRLNDALDDLRELARGIHPAVLSEGGLKPALKALARRSAIPVELKISVGARLSERVEVAAYYVASEALTNAAKHARASTVAVQARRRDGMLHLSITDDGVGGADSTRGSGLIGLGDRVAALGGTISIVSPAGEGTSLRVKLPVS
jgi:signal transduction histidine kinase